MSLISTPYSLLTLTFYCILFCEQCEIGTTHSVRLQLRSGDYPTADEENYCMNCNRHNIESHAADDVFFKDPRFMSIEEFEQDGIEVPRFQRSYLWSFLEEWSKAKVDAGNCRWEFDIHVIEISEEEF